MTLIQTKSFFFYFLFSELDKKKLFQRWQKHPKKFQISFLMFAFQKCNAKKLRFRLFWNELTLGRNLGNRVDKQKVRDKKRIGP
jgi:hypothetical protein